MVPNDTKRIPEDRLLVETGYTTKSFRFIVNFVSLDFWSKMKKIEHAGWSNFQIWGQQIFHDFMASNDTERTTEDILSVDTGYTKNIFRFIENFVRLDFWSPQKKSTMQVWLKV